MSESTLVKMQLCWKSHAMAHMEASVCVLLLLFFSVGTGACLYFIVIARMTQSVFSHRSKLALRQLALSATLAARFY